jgi:ubiquilin
MEDEIQVKIKMTSNAQVYTVKVLKSDTVQTLKEKCQKESSIPPESQNLVYKGRILSNDKLISDYKIENDHTIILVKRHAPSTTTTENKTTTTSNTTSNTTTSNTNNNTSNTSNTNNNTNNNNNNNIPNPFMGMGMGGQMPDLSSLLGNIDPNELNNMMQSLGGMGGLGNLGNLGMGGMNPQTMSQMLNNPMMMQMMQNILSNPEMLQMVINSPQMRQMAQNNPQMQAILSNPQLLQQMLNPQTLQMMTNMLQGMGGNANANNNNNNNNNNPQMPPIDFSQMASLFGNMGGLFGNNSGTGSGNGTGGTENFSNIGINDNNDANVDYKEKYKDQLAQMKDMGFVNEETNIQVLKQCSGNVQFAIERLLNMLG